MLEPKQAQIRKAQLNRYQNLSSDPGYRWCLTLNYVLTYNVYLSFRESAYVPKQTLPDKLEKIMEQYEIILPDASMPLRHKDPQSQHDIHFSVLHNIIHVSNLQEKNGSLFSNHIPNREESTNDNESTLAFKTMGRIMRSAERVPVAQQNGP